MLTSINQATLMKTPMDAFLDSVAAAGFGGVELRRDETFEYLKTHSVSDLKQCLERNGLRVVSWNAIELFSLCSEKEFQAMVEYTERLMRIGNEIGCDLIIAVPSFSDQSVFPAEQMMPKTVERLQVIRKLAARHAFRVGFEPLGFENCSVRKIDMALDILTRADADGLPPSGLVVDTFHFYIGGHVAKDLARIPLDKLWLVHFNDCVEKPIAELHDGDRVWPGEGHFDLEGFVSQLKAMNYSRFVSLELFNAAYWREEPGAAARAAFGSLSRFL